MTVDESYMHRCLQLAALGSGHVAPNPMVGAVLVHDGKIIGEGYHKLYGQAHAEVNCIESVRPDDFPLLSKSTLYVSLEPCAHFGKTPPCADLIIRSNIPKVVVGCRDTYKEVDGRGIQKLTAAGVHVTTGVLEQECKALNKRFFTFHQKQRPYIILKWAQSLNAKIGRLNVTSPAERLLISNPYSNRLVHKWRGEEAGIMIGTNTALYDDPSLTTRLWKGKDPMRIIIDMDLRLPGHLKIFDRRTNTIIFNRIKNEEAPNLVYYKIPSVDQLNAIMEQLYKISVQSVLIEGGASLLQSFVDAGLWDEARVIINHNMQIENGISAPGLGDCILQRTDNYMGDMIHYFMPRG